MACHAQPGSGSYPLVTQTQRKRLANLELRSYDCPPLIAGDGQSRFADERQARDTIGSALRKHRQAQPCLGLTCDAAWRVAIEDKDNNARWFARTKCARPYRHSVLFASVPCLARTTGRGPRALRIRQAERSRGRISSRLPCPSKVNLPRLLRSRRRGNVRQSSRGPQASKRLEQAGKKPRSSGWAVVATFVQVQQSHLWRWRACGRPSGSACWGRGTRTCSRLAVRSAC